MDFAGDGLSTCTKENFMQVKSLISPTTANKIILLLKYVDAISFDDYPNLSTATDSTWDVNTPSAIRTASKLFGDTYTNSELDAQSINVFATFLLAYIDDRSYF